MITRNAKSLRKLFTLWKLTLVLSACIAFVYLCPELLLSVGDESWDLEKIQSYLKASIPPDAKNLQYSSGTNRCVHVELNFKASPQSAIAFTNHFCDGILHDGYDPFYAINIDEPIPGSVKIDMIDYYTSSYYSYSPRSSQNKLGVFCYLPNGLFWILVDKTDPTAYAIKFRHRLDRSLIYTDKRPVAGFPIVARGFSFDRDGSYWASDIVCLDLDPDRVGGADRRWNLLIGTDVQILIDGKVMTAAYVSNDGRLSRKDGKNNYNDPDSPLFKYCLLIWQGGWHRMTIKILPGIGDRSIYSWVFRGGNNASCGDNHPDNDCF